MPPHDKAKLFEKHTLPYLDPLYAYAHSLTGNGVEAEDLVQETFLKAFRAFDSFKDGTNLKAWLFRILKNTFINEFHQKKRFEEFGGNGSEDEAYEKLIAAQKTEAAQPNVEKDVFGGSFGDEVAQALDALPPEFRTAIYMADVEEMSYEEIAEVMEIPIGTVRSRIARGRKILQVRLRKYAKDAGYIKGGG
ncbi:MAG: sigma-70 family RNA polymerase sigma factor [Chitinivibrionia bacterium]|nr:sigma-70 family RNA polymerase sigma factor [Chitinivibrionia bacterium]